jgi:hypothetical protein
MHAQLMAHLLRATQGDPLTESNREDAKGAKVEEDEPQRS